MLQIKNLTKKFGTKTAVNNVSLTLGPKETLALVGESGCGKSTLGKIIVGLLQPTSGQIFYNNTILKHCKAIRAQIQMIFQDPYSSLNPHMSIEQIITEPSLIHRCEQTPPIKLLDLVGIPITYLSRYPHELSGGQRQRVAIARALALNPKLLICDEITSALDLSIQAQILGLLLDLQQELSLSYLFISHDLGVVRTIANRIAVMHRGSLLELETTENLFTNPKNAYTQELLCNSFL